MTVRVFLQQSLKYEARTAKRRTAGPHLERPAALSQDLANQRLEALSLVLIHTSPRKECSQGVAVLGSLREPAKAMSNTTTGPLCGYLGQDAEMFAQACVLKCCGSVGCQEEIICS